MSATHTPGEWTIRNGVNVFGNRTDTGHEGIVANCGGHNSNRVDCGPESAANASLIAAAPCLLAACEEAAADYEITVGALRRVNRAGADHFAALAARLSAAISKARGTT